MTDAKHTHKLKRIKYKSGNVSLFCTLPDCSYKINPALALGKRCICWRCGKEFLLNEYSLRLAKPHCESCHRPKGEVSVTEADAASINFPSLAERLQQTINQAEPEEEEI